MADATVSQARRDDALALGGEPAVEVTARATPAVPRPLAILWAAYVMAVIAFLAFGAVRIGAGNWNGRRMDVREIWSRFASFLIREGASATLVLVVTAAAMIALAGAAYALWLAFMLPDAPSDPATDDAAGM